VSTRIRLRRMGKKKQPFYRIVVADSRTARDARAVEELGTYNPVKRPGEVLVKEDRVYEWLNKGAIPSDTVASLFRRIGVMNKWALAKAGQDTSAMTLKTVLVESKKPQAAAKKAAKDAASKAAAAAAPESAAG
jgi:small subunit ribosomal protein S16